MRLFIVLSLVLGVFPDVLYAATEYATFESFYKESSTVAWLVATVVAIALGAVIFFTGGTASPIVITLGTWVGNLMGLSGIAATNAGLALIGGGAIASGGYGIIGGVALLTAALSFGTEIVIDFTIGKALSTYKYSNLTEQSKKMPTLPLPKNGSGSEAYESAMVILNDIERESAVSSNHNQQLIQQSIKSLDYNSNTWEDAGEKVKNDTLMSLLSFVSNDYVAAKEFANTAITSARTSEIKRTLPAFIYATSSLYEEEFDFTSVTTKYFRHSILAEPENPLIPLLFSIYLDRMSLRFNDGFLDEKSLKDIFEIMQSPSISDHRALNYTILLSRYFIRLKLEQQKISSLSGSSNESIKNSSKTLISVTDSFKSYDILLNDSNDVMRYFLTLEMEEEDRIKAAGFQGLLMEYTQDKERLSTLIESLRVYQSNLPEDELEAVTDVDYKKSLTYIILMLLAVFGFVWVNKFYKKTSEK